MLASTVRLAARIYFTMINDTVSEAIRLYREAGRLFFENRQISKEAMRRFFPEQGTEEQAGEPASSWLEAASRNASDMQRMLERIIALGEDDEALRHHQVYALAHRNLGLYFSRRFKPFHEPFPSYLDEAARHLNTALSLGVKKDRKVARTLGAAYYQSGKLREAVEPLKESIEADPKDEVARYHLCLTYIGLHEREKAREQYEALKLNPTSAHYHLAKMLEPVMEGHRKPIDEAEQEELKRKIEGFRRIRE